MSYFNGPTDPHDYDEGFMEDQAPSSKRVKLNLAIFILILGVVGSTFAANITMNGGSRKEFGQGIFQIKACDQWVGVGLTSGQGNQSDKVYNVELHGLDPRGCKGTIFRIKLFPTGSTSELALFKGAGVTSSLSDSVTAYSLVTKITNVAYTGGNQAAYETWAADAVSLIDPQGRDIGFADDYEFIEYYPSTGIYSIVLTYPLALSAAVGSITIETAKYS